MKSLAHDKKNNDANRTRGFEGDQAANRMAVTAANERSDHADQEGQRRNEPVIDSASQRAQDCGRWRGNELVHQNIAP